MISQINPVHALKPYSLRFTEYYLSLYYHNIKTFLYSTHCLYICDFYGSQKCSYYSLYTFTHCDNV